MHQQLKDHYCRDGGEAEVKLGRYRIDVVQGDRLVEIQHSGLAAINRKVADLVQNHKVDVVKPIVVRKRLVKLDRKFGKVVDQRWSPRTGSLLDLFDELMYFRGVFPNPNLRVIAPLVDIEEIRFPGHGRRRRRRKNDFEVQDRALMQIHSSHTFSLPTDLNTVIPAELAEPFDTGQLAESLGVARWIAQRIAYVMRHAGSLETVGKRGNAWLYKRAAESAAAATRKTARKKSARRPSKKRKTA